MRTKLANFILWLGLALVFGCSKSQTPAAGPVHHHEHKPPHGGAAVELGEEQNHVEIVVDAPAGKLQAFVMDGELENFVRIPAKSLEVTAQVSGRPEKLVLQAVANRATGETVGNTSMFKAQAEWLKTTPGFDAVLEEITVNGASYTNVAFNFPKGSDEGAKK
jgi:hypothetical protein